MARGGKRTGAGRPESFGGLLWLEIAAACQDRWDAALATREATAIAQRPGGLTIQHRQDEANQVPLDERAEWLHSYAASEVHDDIEFALRDVQKIEDDNDSAPNRLTEIEVRRPYGIWKSIFSDVAILFSEKLQRPVSPRQVEDCYEKLTVMQRRLQREL